MFVEAIKRKETKEEKKDYVLLVERKEKIKTLLIVKFVEEIEGGNMISEEKILEVLTNEWQSTLQVTKLTGSNWYIVFWKLNELASQNESKIEKLKLGRNTYWRKNE